MEAFVESMMQALGPFGIALLMFLENVFPPIPSELIMPLAGYLATRGDMNIVMAIAAGTAGSLLGTLPWCYLTKRLGHDGVRRLATRHGRWLTMHPSDVGCRVRQVQAPRQDLGPGRAAHSDGQDIDFRAGRGGEHADWPSFCSFPPSERLSGRRRWRWPDISLGQAYETVADYIDPVSTAVLVILVGVYLYRVATFKEKAE